MTFANCGAFLSVCGQSLWAGLGAPANQLHAACSLHAASALYLNPCCQGLCDPQCCPVLRAWHSVAAGAISSAYGRVMLSPGLTYARQQLLGGVGNCVYKVYKEVMVVSP